jgi:putative tricarboxylic transport membrane protein
VVLPTWRGRAAPADIKEKDLETLSAAVDKMVKSHAWQKVLKERGWRGLYMPRAEFKPFLDNQRTEVSAILKDLSCPNKSAGMAASPTTCICSM